VGRGAGTTTGPFLPVTDITVNARPFPSAVTCPVLVISGSESRITPLLFARKVARKYHDVATYREFSDHANWIIGEPNGQDSAEYITRWLEATITNIHEDSL